MLIFRLASRASSSSIKAKSASRVTKRTFVASSTVIVAKAYARLGESETEYKAHRVSHQWAPEVGKGIPTEEFFGLPLRLGMEIASGQARCLFEAMSEPSPHTGFLNKSEGPLTFDLWIKKMESFDLDFDEKGTPRWPQWFLSQDALKEIQSEMNEGGLKPEQAQRLAELVACKRKEFNEREDRRRLVK